MDETPLKSTSGKIQKQNHIPGSLIVICYVSTTLPFKCESGLLLKLQNVVPI